MAQPLRLGGVGLMARTFQQVKSFVRDTTHNQGLTDEQFERWEENVHDRVGNVINFLEDVSRFSYVPVTNPFVPALDYWKILDVLTTNAAGDTVSLVATDRETVTNWLSVTGRSRFYCVEGRKLYVAPFDGTQTYTIVYNALVSAIDDDSGTPSVPNSNTPLAFFSQLYQYGFLQCAYEYMRDFEAADRYKALFDQELELVRRNEAWRESAPASQMKGAWQWH